MSKVANAVKALQNNKLAAEFICQAQAVQDGPDLLIIGLKQAQAGTQKRTKVELRKQMVPEGLNKAFNIHFNEQKKSARGQITGWQDDEEFSHNSHRKGSQAHLRIENLTESELTQIVKALAPIVQSRGINVHPKKTGKKHSNPCRGKVPTTV